jgi:N-acetylneuraminate synthase
LNNFKLGNRIVGKDYPPLIIAEIGINHNGSLDKAIFLADKAIEAGVEVIKHQTHIPNEEMSIEAKKIIPLNANKSIYELIKKCALNEKDEYKLMKYIHSKKRIFISTPFSKAAADRLVRFKVPAFKIGSGECNNYHFVKYLTKFNIPIIMSTGMNTIKSIKKSVNIIEKKKIPLILLHCTNIYPTPEKLIKLDCIGELQKAYPKCIVGLSDHSQSIFPAIGSIALGGRVIEKHFVHNRKKINGPDVSSSMDVQDLKSLIKASKLVFEARGANKKPVSIEKSTIKFAFASVCSSEDIQVGDRLTKKNICLKRPGNGFFLIKDFDKLIGKKVKKFINKNTQIKKNDLI